MVYQVIVRAESPPPPTFSPFMREVQQMREFFKLVMWKYRV